MASTSASASGSRSPHTLYAYTPSPSSHPKLPLLDPAALYAASLLLNAGVPFNIAAPSTWIHSTLPRLERNASSTIVVAEGIAEIERFTQGRHRGTTSPPPPASLKAAEAQISAHLEPLIYSVLFPVPTTGADGSSASHRTISSQIFDKVTFPAYSAGLPFPTNRIVPHRLKDAINSQLASGSSSLYQALTSRNYSRPLTPEEKAKEEQREQVQSQMKKFDSQGSARLFRFGKAKDGWKEEFVRQRTEVAAQEALKPIASFVASTSVTPGSITQGWPLSPTLLHLFALLAPLVLYDERSIIAEHPISKLLASSDLTVLRSFVQDIWSELFAPHHAKLAAETQPNWQNIIMGNAAAIPITEVESGASARAHRSSSTSPRGWQSYLPSFMQPSASSAPKEKDEPLTDLERRAIDKMRFRRAVWISTAVLGSVGWLTYLFVTSNIQISIVDVDDESEEEEEEEGEEEDAEGWIFTRDGDVEELDDDDDDDDDDDEED